MNKWHILNPETVNNKKFGKCVVCPLQFPNCLVSDMTASTPFTWTWIIGSVGTKRKTAARKAWAKPWAPSPRNGVEKILRKRPDGTYLRLWAIQSLSYLLSFAVVVWKQSHTTCKWKRVALFQYFTQTGSGRGTWPVGYTLPTTPVLSEGICPYGLNAESVSSFVKKDEWEMLTAYGLIWDS